VRGSFCRMAMRRDKARISPGAIRYESYSIAIESVVKRTLSCLDWKTLWTFGRSLTGRLNSDVKYSVLVQTPDFISDWQHSPAVAAVPRWPVIMISSPRSNWPEYRVNCGQMTGHFSSLNSPTTKTLAWLRDICGFTTFDCPASNLATI